MALKEVVRAACAGEAAERLQHVHLELLRQRLALLHDETPVSVRATAVDRLPNDGVREAVDLAKVLQVLRKKKKWEFSRAHVRFCSSRGPRPQWWAAWLQPWAAAPVVATSEHNGKPGYPVD